MKTHKPIGTVGKRKNLRGLNRHLQALVNRLVREEFPELAPVGVSTYSFLPKAPTAAHWHQEQYSDTEFYRVICFNFHVPEVREQLLKADDDDLRDVLRHELLHGELQRQGLPWGDDDVPFIMECLRRKVPVNEPSIRAFEQQYGRGSFNVFRLTLPEPEREVLLLADGTGCWLKLKGDRR